MQDWAFQNVNLWLIFHLMFIQFSYGTWDIILIIFISLYDVVQQYSNIFSFTFKKKTTFIEIIGYSVIP